MCMSVVNQGNQEIKCPKEDCGKIISDYELREILKKDFDEFDKARQDQLVAANPSLIRCSCGNLMEVLEGQVDMN